MGFFNRDKLMRVALSRGYYNIRAVSDGLSRCMNLTSDTIKNKINTGKLTKEECEAIGSFFEMTMKEYYDVFMYGLFQPNNIGQYICHVENMQEHIKPPEPEKPKPKKASRGRKSNIQKIIDEINELDI